MRQEEISVTLADPSGLTSYCATRERISYELCLHLNTGGHRRLARV